MKSPILIAAIVCIPFASAAPAAECRILNPTQRGYRDALVSLPLPAPGPAGSFAVLRGDTQVPYQVEEDAGTRRLWILADFEPESALDFRIEPGMPPPFPARIRLEDEGETLLLENDAVSVLVPAQAREGAPPSGPIAALRLGDRWAAGSGWRTSLAPRRFAVRATARGPLFARARLRYEFEGSGGEDGATPAFAEVSVTVAAGWRHAEVDEA